MDAGNIDKNPKSKRGACEKEINGKKRSQEDNVKLTFLMYENEGGDKIRHKDKNGL